MTEDNTQNTQAGSEQSKHFTENITEAINKIKVASDDAKKRFEQIREENGVDSNDFNAAMQLVTEQAAAAAAAAKAAYENAGGIEGISTTAVTNASKLAANAKVFSEHVADSEMFKQSVEAAKSGAKTVSETDFFKKIADEVNKLAKTAKDTYEATYNEKKGSSE